MYIILSYHEDSRSLDDHIYGKIFFKFVTPLPKFSPLTATRPNINFHAHCDSSLNTNGV